MRFVTGRDTKLNPALQELIKEQRRIITEIQRVADESRYRCLCGNTYPDATAFNDHRATCQLLRVAIIGDIVRVSRLLGRTPAVSDYEYRRLPEMPSVSTITSQLGIFRRWNDAVTEAGLTPNKKGNHQ